MANTNWENVKKYVDIWRKGDTERYIKETSLATYTRRTINNCALGKTIIKPRATTESINTQGVKIYTHQYDTRNVYHMISKMIFDAGLDILTCAPAIHRPKLLNLDPDSVVSVNVHSNGNPIDYAGMSIGIDVMRKYHEITDKNYLPLMCYKHYIPLQYYGCEIFTLETAKPPTTDTALELEYSIITTDPVEPKDDDTNTMSRFNLKLEKCMMVFLPQFRSRITDDGMKFYVGATPILAILTDETENSTIRIKCLNLSNIAICVANTTPVIEYASVRPGVYHLLPYDINAQDVYWRKLNMRYYLGRGDYICNKPIKCFIVANYIISNDGMSCLRYSV
ncbi:hypothetical protein D5b_00204 [Faustovirus]|nr:hypothetical protein D5b_00204 [Faustovirus]AMN84710.1 hypothetical protein D6_00307 [Faustovirus]AMP44158.1 hypothetical protein PRJ_Dakar_00202 [Faustovirus]